MTYVSGNEIIQAFESFAPKSLAMEGDKIGLQVGTLKKSVKKVMVTLDVLESVVDEAISEHVDLIIAHHPIIFRPLKEIHTSKTEGRIIEKLIKHDIAVYAAHTNLDVAPGGVNDLMAAALGLKNVDILVPLQEDSLNKLVVFVPAEYIEKVRSAIGDAGAGFIGNYSHCSYQTTGTGMFLPEQGSMPFIGEQGKVEKVEEVRLETIFPDTLKNAVITALLAAHPYEEPAYDIYPLKNKGKVLGLGRIGELPEEMRLCDFAKLVKQAFSVPGLRVVGDMENMVQRVAVLGGDGNKYMTSAKQKGADVYVTGDMYYHVAHDALALGLNIVDPGHNVEKVMKKGVKEVLDKYINKHNYKTIVIESTVHTDPFQFI